MEITDLFYDYYEYEDVYENEQDDVKLSNDQQLKERIHKKPKYEDEKIVQGPGNKISKKKATGRQDLQAILESIENSLVSVFFISYQ